MKPYPGTQSVLRALAILQVFTDERPSWKLVDLARELSLNKTTVYRLLTALESAGMISRGEGDSYRLGPGILTLAGRALRQNDMRQVARPYLEQLAHDTGETASLDLLVDDEILIFDEVIGYRLVGSVSSLGTRHPWHATSTGKAILACLPEAQVEELLSRPLPSITPQTITDPGELRRQLAQIRQDGYAVGSGELEEDLIVVGAPVHQFDGRVAAAVSVGGPAVRFSPERTQEMGQLVRETAVKISAQLGWSEGQ